MSKSLNGVKERSTWIAVLLLTISTTVVMLRSRWILERVIQSNPSLAPLSHSKAQSRPKTDGYGLGIPVGSDPCAGRPTPKPLSKTGRPPTLFFLHLPKAAGTTASSILEQYSIYTSGINCVYMQDGESVPPHQFFIDGPADEELYSHLGKNCIEIEMIRAVRSANTSEKLRLLSRGGCRTVRGHITMSRLKLIKTPVFLFTILRDPIERFISMYDYGKKTQMHTAAWSYWLPAPTLSKEFRNNRSIFHLPFYDSQNVWIGGDGQWISFFFYGVLHQLSGMYPKFSGIGKTSFKMTNGKAMSEAAMDNLCRMHLIGHQSDMSGAISSVVKVTNQWANYSKAFQKFSSKTWFNLTPNKSSRNATQVLDKAVYKLLRSRLEYEYKVYYFSKLLIDYRKSLLAPGVMS